MSQQLPRHLIRFPWRGDVSIENLSQEGVWHDHAPSSRASIFKELREPVGLSWGKARERLMHKRKLKKDMGSRSCNDLKAIWGKRKWNVIGGFQAGEWCWLGWTFWPLWIMLLWTFTYIHVYSCVVLYRHTFLLLLGIYLGVELLGHLDILFHILKKCQSVLQSGSYHFIAPPAV